MSVSYSEFPKQGQYVSARVKVAFNYDFTKTLFGKVVRDDAEQPFQTIIRLDSGLYVLGEECQYQILNNSRELHE